VLAVAIKLAVDMTATPEQLYSAAVVL
jgi:hypothetical protein